MAALPRAPQLLRVAEVAGRLKVSVKSVRRLIDRGELRRHVSSRVRVSSDDLAEYLAECRK